MSSKIQRFVSEVFANSIRELKIELYHNFHYPGLPRSSGSIKLPSSGWLEEHSAASIDGDGCINQPAVSSAEISKNLRAWSFEFD
jgi:hypothetical protein